ncbi:Dabb family protein [Paenibacillus donghaensis]|uniref:Stress protein n=1 Tax=Paenibacillus donghaensis TaxID=414771 RepID=A0A2Z2KB22_9BACL|nr:Dabb family protein [Paenibacillus donghaensis]ASA20825.1 stress protein [Paenibacillus donghaensis]
MFEHLVAFRFNDSYNPEEGDLLIQTLISLKEQIPGIVEITAGVNVTEETANIHGYTLGLRVTFESREALLAYGPHPAHQYFVGLLGGILDQVVVVDYPVNT